MKITLKIIGIVAFFSLVAYTLTYPYELTYKGTEDIILIEESYKYTSLEQVINRPEFKDKVLFIHIGEPLETELLIPNYTGNNANKVTTVNNEKRIIYSKSKPYGYQLKKLSELNNRYKDKDFKLIFLSNSDSHTEKKYDDIRKWKTIIKKYEIEGTHLIMNEELHTKMRAKAKNITGKRFFPLNIIVNKKGEIINNNGTSPTFFQEKLFVELDSILKQ
jgi:hypothetical protein